MPRLLAGAQGAVATSQQWAGEPDDGDQQAQEHQAAQPPRGKVQATVLPELLQVLCDRKHRLVGIVCSGLKRDRRNLSGAGLMGAGVPPFHFDSGQRVRAGSIDTVTGAVDPFTTQQKSPAIIQIAYPGCFQITAQAINFAQRRHRQRHGQGIVGLQSQLSSHAVADFQGRG
ncbi:hypothetical protein D3C87_1283370 [compost metagenome]